MLVMLMRSRIVDASGTEILEEDVHGKVLLRGPSMVTGYLVNDEATAGAFVDGWLKTGDIAYCKKGKWYLVGRSKVS